MVIYLMFALLSNLKWSLVMILVRYGNFMGKNGDFDGTLVLYGYLILKCQQHWGSSGNVNVPLSSMDYFLQKVPNHRMKRITVNNIILYYHKTIIFYNSAFRCVTISIISLLLQAV